jgi:hypothetical protein
VEIQQRQQQTVAGWSTGRERAGWEPEKVLGFWLVRSASGLEMEGESQPGLYGRTSIHLLDLLLFSFVNLREVNGMGWNGMELNPWG